MLLVSAFGIFPVLMFVENWIGALQVPSRFQRALIALKVYFRNALLISIMLTNFIHVTTVILEASPNFTASLLKVYRKLIASFSLLFVSLKLHGFECNYGLIVPVKFENVSNCTSHRQPKVPITDYYKFLDDKSNQSDNNITTFFMAKATNQITITSFARISLVQLRINCTPHNQSNSSNFN